MNRGFNRFYKNLYPGISVLNLNYDFSDLVFMIK